MSFKEKVSSAKEIVSASRWEKQEEMWLEGTEGGGREREGEREGRERAGRGSWGGRGEEERKGEGGKREREGGERRRGRPSRECEGGVHDRPEVEWICYPAKGLAH